MIKLRTIREQQQLTLRGLAKSSSVGVAILARIEAGYYDPRLSTLRRLANALGVSIGELIGEVEGGGTLVSPKKRRRDMRRMKEKSKEELDKLNEASRAAKKALEQWRKQYIIEGMSGFMWDYDLEEIEMQIKFLQLWLRNQQTAM
jgi:transcriptional regulator with XRE-family HTH domain